MNLDGKNKWMSTSSKFFIENTLDLDFKNELSTNYSVPP
jgi:hypothetical protein